MLTHLIPACSLEIHKQCGDLKENLAFFSFHGKWPHTSRVSIIHTHVLDVLKMSWNPLPCTGSWDFLYTCTRHKGIGSPRHFTSHTHLQSSALSVGSFLFFPFSTRAFPLPCRPKPSFRPVIPVNLMLKRSLQQSITAMETKPSLPAG